MFHRKKALPDGGTIYNLRHPFSPPVLPATVASTAGRLVQQI